jgi:membrane protease subunit HflK
MPWNDNANPGPWGSPPPGEDGERKDVPARRPQNNGGGPKGPRGPGPGGPDLNAGFERIRRRLSDLFSGGGRGVRPGALAAIAGAVAAFWALSGFYVVQPNEQAVVTTFGAWTRSELPGLRYHLPTPIEHVEKVPVLSLNRLDLGGGGTAETDVPQESLMLTSDLDIVDLSWTVTWRIADAGRYIFATRAPEEAVKAVAESAMREVVGKTQVDSIFGNGRGKVQLQTADLMQKTFDGWGAGITIVEVQIKSVNPPNEVLAAFRDVTSALQDKDSAANEADAYRNRVVNEAKGTAAQITQSAEAYREQAVRTALGDAARFNAIDAEYRRSPQATRERLYLETMERVLANSKKVVIPAGKNGTTAPIILPPGLFRSGGDTASTPPVSAPTPPPQQAPQQ